MEGKQAQLNGEADTLTAFALARLLRPTGGAPLHTQLEAALRRLIRAGEIPTGTALPGELELAAELHLSRHTVRHALNALAGEGLLQRERGRGTRVLAPGGEAVTERSLAGFYAFAWEVSARGLDQRSYILSRESVPAPREQARHLGLPSGAPVERIVRLRTAGGEPLVIETAWFPAALAATLTSAVLEHGSIYDALERSLGLHIARAHETIRPVVLSRALAKLLTLRPGSAAFQVERTTWSERGPIEWHESLVRGDRYLYSVDLPRLEHG
ncbi:MAG: GntR family transcriptional regulator [Chloroflexi bacterium]|nr:GntR family transcriptional regulator [Chloroflexota bacterium]